MGQIEKRKKKGRPSKADLAARLAAASVEASPAPASDSDRRRSLRRRSFRYNIIDYDEDYLDDDEDNVEVFEDEDDDEERDEEDEEDEEEDGGRRRREKKVKLVVKLSNGRSGSRGASRGRGRVDLASRTSRRGRVGSQGDEEEEDEEEERVVKKRRINAREDEDEEEEVEEEEEEENNGGGNCEDEERDGKVESKRGNCDIGTPVANNHRRSGTPLPDKKQLELILDKLQKKDTYGVYAEPVDPEELPDYHDIIEHPMDFSTVRKKLANGSYSTLEQFESDVFLISSNAMQYNAPETIYHKQARAIKELAERKFQRVRIQIERLEESKSEAKGEVKSETKPEQRERCNLLLKKITKKPPSRITQEAVGSDFFSGATLATTDAQNSQNAGGADLVGNFERNSNNEGPVEGISSVVENYVEKAEDVLSGKGVLPKFGRRSFVVDENRRATYNMSNQPVDRSDSIFIPFEDEKKQLIPVGLAGEYSYARSLARFAANLGPIAWRIASKRIEQVLPPGFKYGRGWVGEFEPLPTAVLVLKGHKEYPLVSTLHDAADSGKNDKLPECITPAREQLSNQSRVDAKMPSIFGSGGTKPPTPTISIAEQRNLLPRASGGPESAMLKRAALSSSSPKNQHGGAAFQRQHLPRDSAFAENMGVKRVEPNTPVYSQKMNYLAPKQAPIVKEMDANRMETHCSPVSDRRTDLDAPKQLPGGMELPTSRPVMAIHESKDFLQSFSFKQPDSNGGASEGLHNSNGKNVNNFVDSNRVIVSSPASIPTQLSGAAASFPQRQDHGVSDPVLVMKMLTEKAQRQQNGSIYVCSPSPARPSIPSPRGDSGSNAAAAAASAWMSVGAVGFRPAAQTPPGNRAQFSADPHGGKQMLHPQSMQSHVEYPGSATMHFRPEKNGLPFQAFVQQPVKANNEPPIQNRPMAFPPSGTNDLSRFQVQASWRGLRPHTQQKQNQDTLPPDLNVAFQSVDSQQPDLALQL